jgi:hypothetical protein
MGEAPVSTEVGRFGEFLNSVPPRVPIIKHPGREHMTPASEIIVRWYFEQQEADDVFIDDLVSTLYEGCGKGEADSAELLDRVVATALQTEKDGPWNAVIEMAARLHAELTGVDRAIHNLQQLSLISDAVEKMPESPIARRITLMKIKECVNKLKV